MDKRVSHETTHQVTILGLSFHPVWKNPKQIRCWSCAWSWTWDCDIYSI